jgi:hypothetical protein
MVFYSHSLEFELMSISYYKQIQQVIITNAFYSEKTIGRQAVSMLSAE